MKKNFLILNLFLCFYVLVFLCFGAKGANAAFFYLEPDTQTISTNNTFDVNLKINTEGEQVTSADVVLLFDQNILEINNITPNNDFFSQNFENISAEKVYIGGAVQSSTEYKIGEDTIATITFKGKAAGSDSVRFDCTAGKTSDSNISKNDKDATDILSCDKLVNGNYTVSDDGSGGTTPRPTFGPTCSPSPKPSPKPSATPGELPTAGIMTPSIFLLGIGALLTITGVLFTL